MSNPRKTKYWSSRAHHIASSYSRNELSPAQLRTDLAVDYFLKNGCRSPLDVGCGIGETVAAMLAEDFKVVGACDFTPDFVRGVSERYNADGRLTVFEWDITREKKLNEIAPFDCVSALSVLPYVEDWTAFASSLKCLEGSSVRFALSFPNLLFDLFTANEFTRSFFKEHLIDQRLIDDFPSIIDGSLRETFQHEAKIREGSAYAGGTYFHRANPLTIGSELSKFGLIVDVLIPLLPKPAPPWMEELIPEEALKAASARMARESRADWSGTFTASTFLVLGTVSR